MLGVSEDVCPVTNDGGMKWWDFGLQQTCSLSQPTAFLKCENNGSSTCKKTPQKTKTKKNPAAFKSNKK